MNGVITMRSKDLERIKVIERLAKKELTQIEAGKLLGISDRQVRTLLQRYQGFGNEGVISKKLGNNNRQLPQPLKDKALRLIAEKYPDFGPTLATEKLQEIHGLILSIETIRQLMIIHKLWIPHKQPAPTYHPLRPRRPNFGELVIIDGSIEFWFEGRGPKCVLLVFIDDATSSILNLFFTPTEDLIGYFRAMNNYLHKYGRPLALYSDRHAVFNVERKKKDPLTGEEIETMTQFERAMTELDIKLIHANSPQAKGRVERCNRTLQDRFIKELRLQGISDIGAANIFAETYRLEHNKRFGETPAQPTDLHRSLEQYDLTRILRPNHHRVIQKDLSFQYEGEIYQVQWDSKLPILRDKIVVVWIDEIGYVHAQYEGDELQISLFKQLVHQPVITQETAKRWIMKKPRYKPNKLHPYKRSYKIN